MSAVIVAKSKSKYSICAAYKREFKQTFSAFKKLHHTVGITNERAFKNVKIFF